MRQVTGMKTISQRFSGKFEAQKKTKKQKSGFHP